ncbi:hypothetical protein RJ639_047474 [Escallonia herrerae]|uniref:Reverse transcriptase Ty1/copia-type domain-containing protein n=1 Tax=Escallonia herrerae TaxID=1293975 RepID=A0AA88W7I7_9ASTE|nr:hypothetical protein RJ639_047474 [Escallonia herrerae]
MKKKYQGNTRAKRVQLQALRREFEALQMNFGESVSEYFSRATAIANKMRIHGEKLEDVTIVEKILRLMTSKFNFVICFIKESKDIDTLSIDELQSSLLVHEQKITQQDKEEQALQAAAATTTTTNPRGAASQGNWNICDGPNSTGHKPSIHFGKRKGYCPNQGNSHSISNVLFVPDLKTNLLSAGQFQENGYEISIKDGVCQIQDEKLGLIAQVKMTANRIPDEKRKKLDDKREKCIFLGVSDQSKAYKLYNPSTKKIVISRDVVFYEDQTWPWNENGVKQHVPSIGLAKDDEETQMENEQEPAVTPNISQDTQSMPIDVADDAQRSHRARRRPTWMLDYEVTGIDQSEDPLTHFALFLDCDPTTFEEAVKESKWRNAMDDEIAAIKRNNTWELTNLPEGHKTIGVKWVYKTKLLENGKVEKYKARLVAKGYKQEFGVNYKEEFAHVAKNDTIRLVIAFATENSWPIFQLEKALSGLKQAPRAWYSRIDAYFLKEGFTKCPYEHTLFIKLGHGGKMLIVCLYVDDLIFTGNDSTIFDKFKRSMIVEFDMSDLGMMHYFLGIEVKQSAAGIFISQKKNEDQVADIFTKPLKKVAFQ